CALKRIGPGEPGVKNRGGSLADRNGIVCRVISARWIELYLDHSKHAHKGYEHDEIATDYMGSVLYCYPWCIVVPRITFRIYTPFVRSKPWYKFLSQRYLYFTNRTSFAQ